jgi:L-rhamnose isomerase / sugar isomerase
MAGYKDTNIEQQAKRILEDAAAQGRDPAVLLERLCGLRIELPSWGFADTGTRFGKFLQPAAARTTQEKFEDAAEVQRCTGICPSVAVHVLWDFPKGWDPQISHLARQLGLKIGAINPNLFQDQCYKYGSLTSGDPQVRGRALQHCLDSIELGKQAGSSLLSLWLADGTNYPGQDDIRARKRRLGESLQKIHAAMPASMTLLVEYKPFEPAFYHTDIGDWGMAYIFARQAGPRAKVLVDFGHHLPAQNIEQIVAWLLDEGMLGGFHFNDHKYADDDLTFSSIDPYAAFRVFHEIVSFGGPDLKPVDIAYMIDQSHNLKPKIAAMIQTVTMVHELYAKALLVDRAKLVQAQNSGDIVGAETALRDAFFTDVRPLVGYTRMKMGLEPDALGAHEAAGYVQRVTRERTARHGASATGGSYA